MAGYDLLRSMLVVVTLSNSGIRLCHGESETTTEIRITESTPSFMREEEDNSRYKDLEAKDTLAKLLGDKGGVSRSEVFDMLNSRDDNAQHKDLPTFPEDAEDSKVDVPVLPNMQAEFLQAPGTPVRRDSARLRYTAEPAGTAAIIMIVVTCTIVCLAYTSLVLWRRIYLKRNGLKHELLRNEENVAETRIEL